jgi:ATP-binding cassette subfamily B protein
LNRSLIRSLRFMRRYAVVAALAILAVLAGALADLAAPQVVRRILDAGVAQGRTDLLLGSALTLVGIAVAGGLAQFVQGYLSARASHGAAFQMRNAIFEKLQRLSFAWHDTAETGQLVTRVTSDVDLVREFVGGGLVQAVSAFILLVGAMAFLLAMNWQLALVAFLAIPATVFVLLRFVTRLGPTFRATQQRLAALNAVLQENVAGARIVKLFVREPYEAERYRRANEALLEQGLTVRRTVANAFPLLFSTGTVGVVLVTIVGATQVVAGTLTVGELVAFTSYLFLLLQPLFTLGFGAQQVARAGASAERLFEVLDTPVEITERPDAVAPGRLEGRVEFREVGMRYPGAEAETLSNVSFAVEAGTTVAIVGSTGSGKTTLVNLVPRFYDATSGAVLVDGHDVRNLALGALRSAIGVVMQDTFLFTGTIAENIAYGRPDATHTDVEEAARAAAIHDFIAGLPEGYDTLVGERGITLSGGQRQRVAVARALLVEPRILIMDDSASSLDAETEVALRGELERLMEGRTTFVIASRLATVRSADLVLVLDAGRIVDRGTHEHLMATSCVYAEIAASQLADATSLSVPQMCTLLAEGGDA